MALIADDAKHRVEQLLIVTGRLAILIDEETRCIAARLPTPAGAQAEEKSRLANAYRLELARIKQDRRLVEGAPPSLLAQLRMSTERLQVSLAAHEIALGAVKIVAEGLVQAMAEEVVRQRGGAASYGARGALSPASASPAIVDRTA
jgi:hypothetical protein